MTYTHTRTHTHPHTRAHTLLSPNTRVHDSLHSRTHATKAPLGATHTKKLMVCGVEGDARPNPLCMCVCEACAGQLPLHTLAIFMFEPENKGEGGKTGGRRPYHRLPRQKLCLLVSSDPKLVSGTQRAVFGHVGFRTRDALMPSPATLTPSPARRRLIGRGDWLRVLGAGPGILLRSPGPPPLLKALGRGRLGPRPPLCGGSDPGRARARAHQPVSCPAGTCRPCPGPVFRRPAPLGAFLRSCGAVGPRIGPTLSLVEAL